MRNGKSQIKISFMLGFIAGEWQDWLWFSEQQPPVKIVFLFLNEELFWILLCIIAIALPHCLSDWDGYNNNRSVLCQLPKLFHSGKLVLKMILKDDRQSWFGFQVGYQPQKIIFHHHNYPPQSIFKSSVRLLNASSVHSVRRLPCVFLLSGAGLRRFSIQIWPHEENLSECPPRFAVRLCTQASLVLWLFAKDIALLKRFSTMERRNCCGRKAIHHHRANQNPYERWSLPQR